ncbi:MAG: orotate phosphoribosyltransferase [Pseudobdellovibrionaceae bacterium]|jgi:orotate phosphoribosyltransferase
MKEQLAKKLFDVSFREGDFKLRSGQRSSFYFDKYQFESNPQLLKEIILCWLELGLPEYDVLAGLELGGVPLATALSLQSNKPISFIRKKAKEYGTCLISEGAILRSKNVLVVEDVITTGGQVFESVNELRSSGAIVENVICVIDRGENTQELFKRNNLKLMALFKMDELMKYKK